MLYQQAGEAVDRAGDVVQQAGEAVDRAGDVVQQSGEAVERATVSYSKQERL
jgi:hypothetical protein